MAEATARRRVGRRQAGFTLTEMVLVALVLGMTTVVALRQGAEALARERVESATRRLALGLEQGRVAASRSGRPCGLQLGETGWQAPLAAALPPCPGVLTPAGEGIDRGGVRLEHNLPALVRFSSNGLVLDGGTVRIAAEGTALERCLVMSLPLGVVRLGRWLEGSCQGDPAL